MNDMTLPREAVSANHASEIEYAVAMHYSAAYLPSGSSPSLDVESEPVAAPTRSETTPSYTRHLVIEQRPVLFAF
jgi:hypothetical protein